jgi:hypothetical protein
MNGSNARPDLGAGTTTGLLRVGQFTGWHGDRGDGMAELLASEVDILTGDYLAELTMLVLQKNLSRKRPGYVDAFADLLLAHAAEIAARGVKVITNAGGLDPLGLAEDIRKRCHEAGVVLSVMAIDGDDMRPVLGTEGMPPLINIDTGEKLETGSLSILTANAYLGAWPIVAALNNGADVVVCPRTTDASLVVGAAAWRWGWEPTDFDALAGAVVAGHIIECGAQATGGNFSLFRDTADPRDLGLPGMPIAEIAADGSSFITKSVGSGGMVTIDTVTAQLLYEVGGRFYLNPDVVPDLGTTALSDLGHDRVGVAGTRGYAPPPTIKLSLTFDGGFRNIMTVGITGRSIEAKAAWFKEQVELEIGPLSDLDEHRWSIIGPADPHGSLEEATAWLSLSVRDRARERVSRRAFSAPIVSLCTSTFPGIYLTSPPQAERSFGVQWPTLVGKSLVQTSVVDAVGRRISVPWPDVSTADLPREAIEDGMPRVEYDRSGPTAQVELGRLMGTRSGDKAGTANVGIWARSDAGFEWLNGFLTVERLRELLPEVDPYQITRHVLPNLRGINFLIPGFLGEGVAACLRLDPQAKGLGEYLGSRLVSVPSDLLR